MDIDVRKGNLFRCRFLWRERTELEEEEEKRKVRKKIWRRVITSE